MSIIPTNPQLLKSAIRYYEMGLAIMPLSGKQARLSDWTKLVHPNHASPSSPSDSCLLDETKIRTHFSASWADGVGIVLGWNSGNLAILDLETKEVFEAVMSQAASPESKLGAKVMRCPRSRTPSGGAHIYVRLGFSAPPKSIPARDTDGGALIEVLSQGQCAAAPIDISGQADARYWEQPPVSIHEMELFDQDEWGQLVDLLKTHDRGPTSGSVTSLQPKHSASQGHGPITSFNTDPQNRDRVLVALQAAGWKMSNKQPQTGTYLSAPHKDSSDVSASFGGHTNGEVWYFRNFSTSVQEFPHDKPVSPFDVISILEYGGDTAAHLAALKAPTVAKSVAKPENKRGELVTVPLSNFKAKTVPMLMNDPYGRGLFPAGLTVICGDEGSGKSVFARAMVARFTREPSEFVKTPGDVLYLAWQDCMESMIIPGIIAEGGDVRRIHMLEGVAGENGQIDRWSARNIDKACAWLRAHPKVKLVVVDVLETMLNTAKLDSNKSEVNVVLDPLNRIGQELGVAILVLHHTNKRDEGSARSRISGSVQIAATARLVYFVIKDPQDDDLRHLALHKFNLPNSSKGFCFSLTEVSPRDAELNARACGQELPFDLRHGLRRLKHVERDRILTVNELLARKAPEASPGTDDKCAAFIVEQLRTLGPTPTEHLIHKAKEAGLLSDKANSATGTWSRGRRIAESRWNVKGYKRDNKWWLDIDDSGDEATTTTAL